MTDMQKVNMNHKISVIVPVYKVEQYLNRCVDSILNQTYINLEVILVDDGSKDRCPEICDDYAKKDSRIRVIHKENGGLSSARNEGLKCATGEVISLVDSDDYINSNMYTDLMKQMIDNDADIAMCGYKYVYDSGIDSRIRNHDVNAEIVLFDGRQSQFQAFESYEKRVTFTVAWNKLYKKYLFEGITYPDGRIHEDEARTHALLYKANKIAFVDYPYYYYFQRKDSIVGQKVSKANLQLLDAYLDKLIFYRENNEKELWSMQAIHSMHMACYLKKRFDDAKEELNIIGEPEWKRLTAELKRYKQSGIMKASKKAEISFFSTLPAMYYEVWKKVTK
jgi:glycosyltransferase involved in cell wall biosynthesis